MNTTTKSSTKQSNERDDHKRIDRQRLRRLLLTGMRWLDDPTLPDDEAVERASGYLVALGWGVRYHHRRERWQTRTEIWARVAAGAERTA